MVSSPPSRAMWKVLNRLEGVKHERHGYLARCPVTTHGQGRGDRHPSLSVAEGADGRVLMKCHAGCETEAVLRAIGLGMADLFPPRLRQDGTRPTIPPAAGPVITTPNGIAVSGHPTDDPQNERTHISGTPADSTATPQHSGLTVEDYAQIKGFDVALLKRNGVTTQRHPHHGTCVRMPYYDEHWAEACARYRLANTGDKFRWPSGTKAKGQLYGRQHLPRYRAGDSILLVEGESDCHAAWHHDIPALGIPGASMWDEARNAPICDGFTRIYITIEPDSGGEAVMRWLAQSSVRDRAYLLDLTPYKDLSELHASGEDVGAFLEGAMARAVSWTDVEREATREQAQSAWEECCDLAQLPNILDAAADVLEAAGVVGERRILKLLYLILTSRVLPRPINASIKGPSSSGKSYALQRVLELFPDDAYHSLSGMSEKALVYDDTPLQHRYLILYEAAGLGSDFASYIMRSLLSEGVVDYTTVEKTAAGLRSRQIHRDGPTGLLTTTTLVHLHPENETRMLSIPTTDTSEQTKRIMQSLATDHQPMRDLGRWRALQTWIGLSSSNVVVPYMQRLAELIPPVAVRMRRDFALLRSLIETSAILHQATRDQDDAGHIIATIDDYANAYHLAADLLSHGLEASIPSTVAETVGAVATLLQQSSSMVKSRSSSAEAVHGVSVTELAKTLGLDKSAVSRRWKEAERRGFLQNLEEKRGKPARIVLGDPLPDAQVIFPPPDQLEAGRCSVDHDPAEHGKSTSHRESAHASSPPEVANERAGGESRAWKDL